MFGIFEGIGDFFSLLGHVFNFGFTIIGVCIDYLIAVFELFGTLFLWLPLTFSVPVLICMIVGIFFKVLGRNSNDDN